MPASSYIIYNASAGSGKTHTLVRACLRLLLTDSNPLAFRKILALTFTNKAVKEMKERIVSLLSELANPTSSSDALLQEFSDISSLNAVQLQKRAQNSLQAILNNYSSFNISTIDKFNLGLIRLFAAELKVAHRFRVSTDNDLLLSEAVDRFLNKLEDGGNISDGLRDFVLLKLQNQKSWDISNDLLRIAHLLIDDLHAHKLASLKAKSDLAFNRLKKTLIKRNELDEIHIKKRAAAVLESLKAKGFESSDFLRQLLWGHFEKIAGGNFQSLYSNRLEDNLETGLILKKAIPIHKKEIFAEHLPEIQKNFKELKIKIGVLKLNRNILNNLGSLTVLKQIVQEVDEIKKRDNILPVSEFNLLIRKITGNNPTPFIYERLGARYQHFFIDEFQDTSEMQWLNIIPLIGNALESETERGEKGSLFLVGDAKQAIYRWRGGKTEQLKNIGSRRSNPFQVKPQLYHLPANYRSCSEIVGFNNRFFSFCSSYLNKSDHAEYYRQTNQEIKKKESGYVHIQFLEKEEDPVFAYAGLCLNTINTCIQQGFKLSDICVLTHKKKEGRLIANYLIEHNIPVASSETLLLAGSPVVQFLIHLLYFLTTGGEKKHALGILFFLANKKQVVNTHQFVEGHLHNSLAGLFSEYKFDLSLFNQLAQLEAVHYAIHCFDLAQPSDAWLQHYTDLISDFTLNHKKGWIAFLGYWEQNKENLSVSAPETLEAVKIMTIHKAKGLEFEVVVYPFANTFIYEERRPSLWIDLHPQNYEGFDSMLISKTAETPLYGETISDQYEAERQNLELDRINMLYVALTRAISRLYIFTLRDLNRDGNEKPAFFSGLLIGFLKQEELWNDNQNIWSFGYETHRDQKLFDTAQGLSEKIPFINSSSFPVFQSQPNDETLFPEMEESLRQSGELIHGLLAQIFSINDISPIFRHAILAELLTKDEALYWETRLSKLFGSEPLQSLFSDDTLNVLTEKEIVTPSGKWLRPDRLNINARNEVFITEYKTGIEKPEHEKQIASYANVLRKMNFTVGIGYLVYLHDRPYVKKV